MEQGAINVDGPVETGTFAEWFCLLLQWPLENEGELTPELGGDLKVTAQEGDVVSISTTSEFEVC